MAQCRGGAVKYVCQEWSASLNQGGYLLEEWLFGDPHSPTFGMLTDFLGKATLSQSSDPERYRVFFVPSDSLVPIAWCFVRQIKDTSELDYIGVKPEFRSEGLGESLLLYSMDKLNRSGVCEMILEVGERNEKAYKLYLRLGFAEISRRNRYYRDGQNAIIMRKCFSETVIS